MAVGILDATVLQIIYFGREHCTAKAHDAQSCTICSWAAVTPFDRCDALAGQACRIRGCNDAGSPCKLGPWAVVHCVSRAGCGCACMWSSRACFAQLYCVLCRVSAQERKGSDTAG